MTVNASDSELRSDDLVIPLSAFLSRAAEIFNGDLQRAADHVHYPTGPESTLVGSSMGRAVWDSQEGKQLVSLLLSDAALRKWFGGREIRLAELRAILASVIRSWAASNQSESDYAGLHAANVLQALTRKEWSCWAIGVGYGVTVKNRVDLPGSYAIDPDVVRALANVVANDALTEVHLMRMNKGFGCLFLYGASASRDMFGPYAASTAMAWGRVAFERLKKSVWLASSIFPVVGDFFVTDVSPYPVVPVRHFPAPVQSYPTTVKALDERELDLLGTTILRLDFMQERASALDRETELQLRLALSHVDAVFQLADSLLAALLIYVALEAILLYEEDDDSRLGPRVAWLIGIGVEDRKSLSRLVTAYREVRGDLAHGKPPRSADLTRVLGRNVSPDEVDAYFTWSGHETGQLFENRCRELLRKVLLSFLNLALNIGPGDTVSLALTRQQIIERLDAARRGGRGAEAARNLFEDNSRSLFA
ncbi:MAG: hypothetical protein QGM45_12205 [Anaerolineales bacterium]|nr:hypothetical protein [Anaerolineales bacterium]